MGIHWVSMRNSKVMCDERFSPCLLAASINKARDC